MVGFPKGYLEDEERDGFLISGEVKSAWAAQIEILSVIDRICNKYGIKYFASYGTLLGAARHNGYIPWDDDLDIGMLREDYEMFLKVAPDELPEGFDVLNAGNTCNWKNLISRVVNSVYISSEELFLIKFHGCPYVTGVDIFPFDFMPKSLKTRDYIDEYFHLAVRLVGVEMEEGDDPDEFVKIYDHGLKTLEKEFKIQFDRGSDIVSQLVGFANYLASSYSTDKGSIVTNYWNYEYHSKNFIFHEIWFSEIIELGFEVTSIKAPIGVEAILNICYGNNFMTPRQVKGAHDYPYFKEQRKMLVEKGLDKYVDEKRRMISDIMYSETAQLVKEELKEPLPDEVIKPLANKKIILYALNSASVIRQQREVFDKLERAIKIFEDAKENIAVILAEDITFLATLNAMYPDLFEKYMALRQSVEDKGIGFVSDNLYYDFASVCDAYYGDGTTVVGDFMKAGKPVMLQNYTL